MNISKQITNELEKILKIEEGSYKLEKRDWSKDGFKITTNKQEIFLLIDSDTCCCENWGYFMTEDEDSLNKFIGAAITDITLTDSLLKTIDFQPAGDVDNDIFEEGKTKLNMYEGDCMFVNINTNIGVLQFVAYNEHNGYYGHEAVVASNQLTHSTTL